MFELNPDHSPTTESTAPEILSHDVVYEGAGCLTFDEARAAKALAFDVTDGSRLAARFLYSLLIAGFVYSVVAVMQRSMSAGLIVLTAGGIVLGLLIFGYRRGIARLKAEADQKLGMFQSFTFLVSRDGFWSKNSTSETRVKWSHFASVKANDSVATLHMRQENGYAIVTRRMLQDLSRWDDFVSFIRNEIDRNAATEQNIE